MYVCTYVTTRRIRIVVRRGRESKLVVWYRVPATVVAEGSPRGSPLNAPFELQVGSVHRRRRVVDTRSQRSAVSAWMTAMTTMIARASLVAGKWQCVCNGVPPECGAWTVEVGVFSTGFFPVAYHDPDRRQRLDQHVHLANGTE